MSFSTHDTPPKTATPSKRLDLHISITKLWCGTRPRCCLGEEKTGANFSAVSRWSVLVVDFYFSFERSPSQTLR